MIFKPFLNFHSINMSIFNFHDITVEVIFLHQSFTRALLSAEKKNERKVHTHTHTQPDKVKCSSLKRYYRQKRDHTFNSSFSSKTRTQQVRRVFNCMANTQAHETSSNEDNKYLWIPTSFTLINIIQMPFFPFHNYPTISKL